MHSFIPWLGTLPRQQGALCTFSTHKTKQKEKKRKYNFLEICLSLWLGQEKSKIRREYLMVPRNQEGLRNDGDRSKGHMSHFEGALTGQTWGD